MRWRAKLALHEALIDIEWAGPKHTHRTEDGLEEGDAFLILGTVMPI